MNIDLFKGYKTEILRGDYMNILKALLATILTFISAFLLVWLCALGVKGFIIALIIVFMIAFSVFYYISNK